MSHEMERFLFKNHYPTSLYRRGLKQSLLFIADGINNLDEEIMNIYPGSDFQLCTIHYIRGLKSKVKEKDLEIMDDANKMFRCNNKEEVIIRFNEFKNKWGIRRRIKTVSSFPDEDSAMKIFYLKSIEFNSRHAFRKMNGSYKCHDEIKEMFNRRYPL